MVKTGPVAAAMLLAAFALLLAAGAARAQAPVVPADDARVRQALDAIRRDSAWTLEQQVSICEVPAPPFGEAARAAELKRRFQALGLGDARIDAEGNVIALRRGAGAGPTVMISGHLDTVFPEGTDVKVRRVGARLLGPGIGDDCRGLAVLLAVARAFRDADVRTRGSIYFVGTVGEEGEGNLRGVRHLFGKEFPTGSIDYFISVDGTGYGTTTGAVGSVRYRVTYAGPGGHSYGAFGMPNPLHALGRAIAGIGELQVPTTPRTTFSVGIVRGGTSVNSIAMEGSIDIDMRSTSTDALRALDAEVRRELDEALTEEHARWPGSRTRLRMTVDTLGIRPGGLMPDDSPLVRAALESARALGFTSPTGSSSTDANFPMSLGVPAITIDGGGRGGSSHSLDEWYEDGPEAWRGPQWAALLVATLAGT